jgi:hypothetical protein
MAIASVTIAFVLSYQSSAKSRVHVATAQDNKAYVDTESIKPG